MADAKTFGDDLFLTAKNIVSLMDHLDTVNQRIAADSTLLQAVEDSVKDKRPDVTLADLTAFNDALTQLLFTYNSGSPSQKAKIFELL